MGRVGDCGALPEHIDTFVFVSPATNALTSLSHEIQIACSSGWKAHCFRKDLLRHRLDTEWS